ncbi:D-alanyl-D-alanine carboxypeptidase [Spongiactinospora sp. TRM90649]|uniref:D-alanyl-D-alanine carboxypeptidase family protein n=1 Tax=Spongiactinospora sp. TRM90649 TaxID=3031114 RepID=UPI0023F82156|nr:D-alanyl-D-alanine carboxypeptidase [Spongiactinospora sp. TRM90649]MDF5751312.1 D-alanyl-D-alanine carboxypeptidase [Spongiactinospora sp. TRM90649]
MSASALLAAALLATAAPVAPAMAGSAPVTTGRPGPQDAPATPDPAQAEDPAGDTGHDTGGDTEAEAGAAGTAAEVEIPAGAGSGSTPIGGELLGRRGIVLPQGMPAGMKAPPKTKAKSFVIADAGTGQVLAAKDPHGHYLPASTLKTLTALTLIPKLNKDTKIRPSANACNQEGTAVGLNVKGKYRVEDLFLALMMSSGNDAAMALAEANGSLRTTMADMNAEAKRLQALDTVAKTPSGLDKPGQRSSAYDLALIARAGLANADFRRYISTRIAKFPAPKGKYYEISNHNRLLGRYRGMIGIKNGWTSKAMGSFVGAARRGENTIIVAIMRHEGSFWDEVGDLLDWGFAARGKVTPVGQLVDPVPEVVPTKPVGDPRAAAPAASASAPAAAPVSGKSGGDGGSTALVVAGAGLLGGIAWLLYGLERRARTRRRARSG